MRCPACNALPKPQYCPVCAAEFQSNRLFLRETRQSVLSRSDADMSESGHEPALDAVSDVQQAPSHDTAEVSRIRKRVVDVDRVMRAAEKKVAETEARSLRKIEKEKAAAQEQHQKDVQLLEQERSTAHQQHQDDMDKLLREKELLIELTKKQEEWSILQRTEMQRSQAHIHEQESEVRKAWAEVIVVQHIAVMVLAPLRGQADGRRPPA